METLNIYKNKMEIYKKAQISFINNLFCRVETWNMGFFPSDESYLANMISNKMFDVNMVCKDDDSGDTILHRASACGNITVVCYLLNSCEIDIGIKNKKDKTAAEVICTRLSSILKENILKQKCKYSKYILDQEEYFCCQDSKFENYRELKKIFMEAAGEPGIKRQKI